MEMTTNPTMETSSSPRSQNTTRIQRLGSRDYHEDDFPIVGEELTNCSKFEHLYLIGKLVGETMPLKTIVTKTTA